jgi:hypothetical protein
MMSDNITVIITSIIGIIFLLSEVIIIVVVLVVIIIGEVLLRRWERGIGCSSSASTCPPLSRTVT